MVIFTVTHVDGIILFGTPQIILEGNSDGILSAPAGLLDYTITDENGTELCSGNIEMTSDAQVDVCEIFPQVFCQGNELVFEVEEFWCPNLNNLTSISWSDGSTAQFFNTTAEGTYSGFFIDDMGCQGQVDFVVDFSEFRTVSGIVWQDSPSGIDGVFQNGEDILTNTEVRLYEEIDPITPIDMVLTDDEGGYIFENLVLTTSYLVSIDVPAGFEFSPQGVGNNSSINSQVDPLTGFATYLFECTANGFPSPADSLNIGIKAL